MDDGSNAIKKTAPQDDPEELYTLERISVWSK